VDLGKKANQFRSELIKFKTATGSGHLASSLSIVDVLISIYLDSSTYFDHKKDVLVFGKAHGGPALYPILAELGYFKAEELDRYCRPGGILRMHPDRSIPGCTYVGGSLGNGIGFAAGLAWAERQKQTVVILGDAELYEGSVWESLLFIAHWNLNNLLIIVDRNGLGILGPTEELLRLEPLSQKFESFGFEVLELNGHDFGELREAMAKPPKNPTVIIANTVKAKGVDFMENRAEYHTIIPRETSVVASMLEGLK
jgi:transketolase